MKSISSKTATARKRQPAISSSKRFPQHLSTSQSRAVQLGLLLFSIAAGLLYIIPMPAAAGAFGFTIDDSWIPLTFARNLREFGAYSFFQDQIVTSGSTSPLYVFVLSLLGIVIPNEFVLTYIIGIVSLTAVVLYVYRIGLLLFNQEQWLAVATSVLVILTPRLQSAAVSGMATMFFTALVVTAAYAYYARHTWMFFALGGLALWTRPDALVFLLAAGIHMVYHHLVVKEPSKQDPNIVRARTMTGALAVCGAMIAGYVAFNLSLSGSVFPNSIPAKLAYFKGVEGGTPFLQTIFAYFVTPPGGVMIVFALAGVVFLVFDLVKRRTSQFLLPVLFILGTIAAYGFFLPFLYDDGRYLAPTLPFFLLAGVWGLWRLIEQLSKAIPIPSVRTIGAALSVVVLLGAAVSAASVWKEKRSDHFKAVQYVNDRHVAAGKWINTNTPDDAVIATHTIGTMGFYGQRRITDLFGIVSPEVIPEIGNLAALELRLATQRTDYVATLRERFEVVNVNPVFTSDESRPEVMEIFPYHRGKTHLLPQRASMLNTQAARLLQNNMSREALQILQESYSLDPNSSRTSTLLGLGFLSIEDTANAMAFLDQALVTQGDYAPAMVPLGDIHVRRREYATARGYFSAALRIKPDFVQARKSLDHVDNLIMEDTLRKLGYKTMKVGQ